MRANEPFPRCSLKALRGIRSFIWDRYSSQVLLLTENSQCPGDCGRTRIIKLEGDRILGSDGQSQES